LAACSFEHGEGAPDANIEIPTVVDCPLTYDLVTSHSKYRVIATVQPFNLQHLACIADDRTNTHLASLETEAEMLALRDALAPRAADLVQYFIGAVQQPNSPLTTDNWFVFSGGPLPPGHFGSSNDDNPGENNEENLGSLSTVDLIHDVTGDIGYPAVCECDGRPIDPTVASYLP
jgi:hypothetical protein